MSTSASMPLASQKKLHHASAAPIINPAAQKPIRARLNRFETRALPHSELTQYAGDGIVRHVFEGFVDHRRRIPNPFDSVLNSARRNGPAQGERKYSITACHTPRYSECVS